MFRLRMLPVAILLGLLLAFSVAAACGGGAAEPPGSRSDTPSTPALSPAELEPTNTPGDTGDQERAEAEPTDTPTEQEECEQAGGTWHNHYFSFRSADCHPATPTPEPTEPTGPTVPVPTATETAILNRQNCGAISGTAYRSEQERQWYLGNCITPATTLIPTATPAGCGAPQNPWGYGFCPGGTRISSPPSDFCSYFACIGNFWNGRGYVIQCRDGMFGKSGAIQGSCSYHGGNNRALLETVPPPPQANCSPSYPTVCIPPYPPDLNCDDIPFRRFTVLPPDRHRFDGDNDGVGCESG